MTYSDYFPYSPSKSNFTMEYHGLNFGVENASEIGLNQAVALATDVLNLTVPLQLGYATFYPGTIVNGTLAIHPEWYLFFAAEYDGYWAWGSYGNGAFSVEVDVDALSGVSPAGLGRIDLSNMSTSGQFELNVNSSQALEALRSGGGRIPGMPAALTESGTVSFIEPKFVLFGPGSNNVAFKPH